MTRLLVLY